MPASHRLLFFPITALILILIGCEPTDDTAEIDRVDTSTAQATDPAVDTAAITITHPPDNAVICGAGTRVFKPGGGLATVSLPPQGHQLEVRPNSVPSGPDVRFSIRDLRKPYLAVDVSAQPDVPFDEPVQLRLSYKGCEVPKMSGLAIFRWEQTQQGPFDWVEVSNSTISPNDSVASVDLNRLSQYALGAS